jgi:DNA-binding NarL/FixJ family response regulator
VRGNPLQSGVDAEALLTGRQKQILDLLCRNMTSRQVGAVLDICARTVDNHCVHICRTLGVRDRFEAVRLWSAERENR